MTITNTAVRQRHSGAIAGATAIPTTFVFRDDAQVAAEVSNDATGIITTWVLGTDFTLTGGGTPPALGTLTTITPVAAGDTLTIYRDTDAEQNVDYTPAGDFPAEANEGALDYLTMLEQEDKEKLLRCVKLPPFTSLSEPVLPLPQPGYAIGWNGTGTGLENIDITTDITVTERPDMIYLTSYGSTYDEVTINAAIASIGSLKKLLFVNPGTWTIADNVTFPQNIVVVFANGGIFKPLAGKVVTFANSPALVDYQIFDLSLSGVTGVAGVKLATPEMFGAIGDGTDDSVAFGYAIAGDRKVVLKKGTYGIALPIVRTAVESAQIVGQGMDSTFIKWIGASGLKDQTMLTMSGSYLQFRDLTFDGDYKVKWITQLTGVNNQSAVFKNVRWTQTGAGWHKHLASWTSVYENCLFNGMAYYNANPALNKFDTNYITVAEWRLVNNSVSSAPLQFSQANNTTFKNLRFHNWGMSAASVTGIAAPATKPYQMIYVSGNAFEFDKLNFEPSLGHADIGTSGVPDAEALIRFDYAGIASFKDLYAEGACVNFWMINAHTPGANAINIDGWYGYGNHIFNDLIYNPYAAQPLRVDIKNVDMIDDFIAASPQIVNSIFSKVQGNFKNISIYASTSLVEIGGNPYVSITASKGIVVGNSTVMPTIDRVAMQSGGMAFGVDAGNTYLYVTGGYNAFDTLGNAVMVGSRYLVAYGDGVIGHKIFPPVGAAGDYYLCVDYVGNVFIEKTTALRLSNHQKLILMTFTIDAAGAITASATINEPRRAYINANNHKAWWHSTSTPSSVIADGLGDIINNTDPSSNLIWGWKKTAAGTIGVPGAARPLYMYPQFLTGSVAWNPGSIADGDKESKDITVTGAALGDFVMCSFSLDTADLGLVGAVTAANVVTATLMNNTGGAVDLGAGTVRAFLIKQ